MEDGKKAEASVNFLLLKLDKFRSEANNLTTEELNVIDDMSSALTNLREIVKPLDTIKPNDRLGYKKQSLDGDLHKLSIDQTIALDVPQLQPGGRSTVAPCNSLQDTLSKIECISREYKEILRTLHVRKKEEEEISRPKIKREGEGSSVTKSTLANLVEFRDYKNLINRLLEEDWPERVRYLSVQGGTIKDLNGDSLLRYLRLRDTSIEVIPASIERLTHLEFLDLKHSLVTELPKEAEQLEKIRHILIYHHEKDPMSESYILIGFKASCRVRGFKHLEKLCFVEADKRTLQDLGNLTKLKRLGITELRKEDGKFLCSSLEKLEELNSLNVHALNEEEIIDLQDLSSSPKNLKHLYLHGRMEKLPDWIPSLNNLTKIILRWSQLEGDLPATLGKLQNLVELQLRRAYDGENLVFKEGQFLKLKILLLEELEALRSMCLKQGALPSLENLTFNRCAWLKEMPSGILDNCKRIRKLVFFDMSDEFYENVKRDHKTDNYKKFRDIEEVSFTRRRAGHWKTHQVDGGCKS